MRNAINETNRRRTVQEAYNKMHNITPQSIKKNIQATLRTVYEQDYFTVRSPRRAGEYLQTVDIPRTSPRSRNRCARRRKSWTLRQRRSCATR